MCHVYCEAPNCTYCSLYNMYPFPFLFFVADTFWMCEELVLVMK